MPQMLEGITSLLDPAFEGLGFSGEVKNSLIGTRVNWQEGKE